MLGLVSLINLVRSFTKAAAGPFYSGTADDVTVNLFAAMSKARKLQKMLSNLQ
jgi:hypothetical protein